MDDKLLNTLASALRQVLGGRPQALTDEAARETVTRFWAAAGLDGDPLAGLDAALRAQGTTLDGGALTQVAWALLGVSAPRGVRLTPGTRGRLSHLVELHDLSLPSRARELGGQLARERALAPDLLRARPWLTGVEGARDVLGAVFETEWSGFLGLLGDFGPWVYVASVADLQALSRRYAALVEAASGAGDAEVLAAAVHWHAPFPGGSLLARLEATDHRTPAAPRRAASSPPASAALVEAEAAFWHAAQRLARERRDGWAARRGR